LTWLRDKKRKRGSQDSIGVCGERKPGPGLREEIVATAKKQSQPYSEDGAAIYKDRAAAVGNEKSKSL
jgi:hypothetical protein